MPTERMKTIDAQTLMDKKLADIQFIVAGLLPQGLQILAGKAKAGGEYSDIIFTAYHNAR